MDLSGITTISFDGDGTLWDFQAAMRGALADTLAELGRLMPGERVARLTVAELVRLRDEVDAEWGGRAWRLEDIWLESFRRALERVGAEDGALAQHLNAFYMERRFARIVLYEDVLPALNALAQCYRLGLVSNGNTYPERCGLAGRFDFVLFAQDCGYSKPDPRVFACALERAGCRAGQLLHVGDSLPNDVQGARDVGIRAVWLNRTGTANETDITPDVVIATLTELVALLMG